MFQFYLELFYYLIGAPNETTILDKAFADFFHFLTQFPFTAIKMELHYYHQKVKIRVARLHNTQDLRDSKTFKKTPELLGIEGEYLAYTQQGNFESDTKILQKIGCKTFSRKTYFIFLFEFICNILSKLLTGLEFQISDLICRINFFSSSKLFVIFA